MAASHNAVAANNKIKTEERCRERYAGSVKAVRLASGGISYENENFGCGRSLGAARPKPVIIQLAEVAAADITSWQQLPKTSSSFHKASNVPPLYVSGMTLIPDTGPCPRCGDKLEFKASAQPLPCKNCTSDPFSRIPVRVGVALIIIATMVLFYSLAEKCTASSHRIELSHVLLAGC